MPASQRRQSNLKWHKQRNIWISNGKGSAQTLWSRTAHAPAPPAGKGFWPGAKFQSAMPTKWHFVSGSKQARLGNVNSPLILAGPPRADILIMHEAFQINIMNAFTILQQGYHLQCTSVAPRTTGFWLGAGQTSSVAA